MSLRKKALGLIDPVLGDRLESERRERRQRRENERWESERQENEAREFEQERAEKERRRQSRSNPGPFSDVRSSISHSARDRRNGHDSNPLLPARPQTRDATNSPRRPSQERRNAPVTGSPARRPANSGSLEPLSRNPPLIEPLIPSLTKQTETQPSKRDQLSNPQPSSNGSDSNVLFDRQQMALYRIFDTVCQTKRQMKVTALDGDLNLGSYPERIEKEAVDMIRLLHDFEKMNNGLQANLQTSKQREKELESERDRLTTEHKINIAEIEKDNKTREDANFKRMMKIQGTKNGQIFQLTNKAAELEKELVGVEKRHTEEQKKAHKQHVEEQKKLRRGLEDQSAEALRKVKNENAHRVKKLEDQASVAKKKLEDQLSVAKKKHEDDQKKLRKECDTQKADELRKQRFELGEQINLLKGENQLVEAQKKTMLKDHANQLAEAKQKIEAQFAERINQLNLAIARMEKENRDALRKHKEDREELIAINRKRVDDINQAHEEAIRAQEEKFAAERSDRINHLQKTMDRHRDQITGMQSDHDKDRRLLIAKYEEEKTGLSTIIAGQQAKFDAEKDKLLEHFDAERKQAEREKELETRSLKVKNEKLKVALVTRDHFKAMTDHQILTRFQDVAGEVDDFARVKWEVSKEGEWPWPQHVLKKSDNERRLKHDIIQSRIWVILYQYIFCTPFRVLGDEGKSLERQWAEASGQVRRDKDSLEWPRPYPETEKWRYEQVKKCLDALERGESDLKEGYESSLMNVGKELSKALGSVSPVDKDTAREMRDLARKAAKLWLELGTQRCRIFFIIPDQIKSGLQGGNGRRDRRGTLELILHPELRRIGNSQGEELDREEVVTGLQGEYTEFTP